MDAHEIFKCIAKQERWTYATQIAILLQYIERQAPAQAFEDFLEQERELSK